MSLRNILLGFGLVVLVGVSLAGAQLIIQPGHGFNQAYRVRVVNEMGMPIRIKMFSYAHDNYFHADLRQGQSVSQNLWAGDRVVGVWDRSGTVILTSSVRVDRNGILRLQPFFGVPAGEMPRGAAPRAAEPEAAAPAGGTPMLQLESE